jgi:hypothetical protein
VVVAWLLMLQQLQRMQLRCHHMLHQMPRLRKTHTLLVMWCMLLTHITHKVPEATGRECGIIYQGHQVLEWELWYEVYSVCIFWVAYTKQSRAQLVAP